MKKKLFGIKIGTIISAILCLIVAVVFWFFVEYSKMNSPEAEALILDFLRQSL